MADVKLASHTHTMPQWQHCWNIAEVGREYMYFKYVLSITPQRHLDLPIKQAYSRMLQLQTAYNILNQYKVSKGAKIRSRYNQVPHPTQDTNGKVTNSQLDTTNESQEVSPFPAGDHKAHINRPAQRHSKHKTEQKHKRSTQEVPNQN